VEGEEEVVELGEEVAGCGEEEGMGAVGVGEGVWMWGWAGGILRVRVRRRRLMLWLWLGADEYGWRVGLPFFLGVIWFGSLLGAFGRNSTCVRVTSWCTSVRLGPIVVPFS